jgi:hypothetical protein
VPPRHFWASWLLSFASTNNDKFPRTNMHTTLKHYLGFNLPQTMRGMMSNLEVEMVLLLGMMKMLMKM